MNYREIIIKSLPGLNKLDNNNVTNEERISSQNIQSSIEPKNQEHKPEENKHNHSTIYEE